MTKVLSQYLYPKTNIQERKNRKSTIDRPANFIGLGPPVNFLFKVIFITDKGAEGTHEFFNLVNRFTPVR